MKIPKEQRDMGTPISELQRINAQVDLVNIMLDQNNIEGARRFLKEIKQYVDTLEDIGTYEVNV